MGKGNAKRHKKDGKMAFYKRMRKDHPGARDEDIKKQWDERVAKDAVAKQAAEAHAKATAELKALHKLQAEENEKKFVARKAAEEKAAAAKAKADKEAAELAKLEAEAKPATPEAPAVTA